MNPINMWLALVAIALVPTSTVHAWQSSTEAADQLAAENLFQGERIVDIQIEVDPQDWDQIRTVAEPG